MNSDTLTLTREHVRSLQRAAQFSLGGSRSDSNLRREADLLADQTARLLASASVDTAPAVIQELQTTINALRSSGDFFEDLELRTAIFGSDINPSTIENARALRAQVEATLGASQRPNLRAELLADVNGMIRAPTIRWDAAALSELQKLRADLEGDVFSD